MSFYLIFSIAAFIVLMLGAIIIRIIENDALSAIIWNYLWHLIGLAITGSFVICMIFSVITDYLAKDYLNTVGEIIDDKEIIEVQVNDKLIQDSAAIIYKDSNGDPVIYNTTLPWYCDIEVEQSKKTYIEIDSSHNTFYVYTDTSGESGDTYTSKK